MTDLSSLSDADLQALYSQSQGGGGASPAPADLSQMSDDQLKSAYAATQQAAAPAPSQSWGDVASSAAQNIIPSGKRFVGDIVGAVSDPVGTAKNVFGFGAGLVEKGYNAVTGNETPGPHEEYANAVGKMISDRYGSVDKLKETIASDPVGFAADLSTLLTGGEMAAARVPVIGSQAAKAVGAVARTVDPINAAVSATGATARGVGKVAAAALGTTTGVGSAPIEAAAAAGRAGGDASRALTENMRGAVPMEDVIGDAKGALQNIKDERQAAYKSGMGDLSKDNTVLDFNKIDNAWDATKGIGSYQGPSSGISMSLSPSTAATVKEVDHVLNQWRGLPPGDFHTATGLDALKQRLGDIVDAAAPGTAAQKVATRARNIVKDQITAQAPEYAKTMAGYANASDLIKQMESTLSQNRTASVDTQLRKLQSVMRDGVATNYGARTKLVKTLEAKGATNIMQKLAGQSLSSIAPRGIARAAAAVTDLGTLGALIMNPGTWGAVLAHLPIAAGALAAQSPRVVGEAAHLAGQGARLASAGKATAVRAVQGSFQAGRIGNQ